MESINLCKCQVVLMLSQINLIANFKLSKFWVKWCSLLAGVQGIKGILVWIWNTILLVYDQYLEAFLWFHSILKKSHFVHCHTIFLDGFLKINWQIPPFRAGFIKRNTSMPAEISVVLIKPVILEVDFPLLPRHTNCTLKHH